MKSDNNNTLTDMRTEAKRQVFRDSPLDRMWSSLLAQTSVAVF
jgi:hypothetical protein